MDVEKFLDEAIELAVVGGQTALEWLGEAVASRKADSTIVTEADHAVQDKLLAHVAERFPDHAVVAEEAQSDPTRHATYDESRFCWVIDPIDGTRNFSRGIPIFATVVALMRDGFPVVGAIFDPNGERLFAAAQGCGATLNGQPIRAEPPAVAMSPVIGMPSSQNKPLARPAKTWLDQFNYRNFGSTALHMAMVASGELDAAFCEECRIWDVAAGWRIATEAGAVCTTPDGSPRFPVDPDGIMERDLSFVVARPELQTELVKLLNWQAQGSAASSASR